VRELENVIRRAMVVSKGDTILPSDLSAEVAGASGSTGSGTSASLSAAPTGVAGEDASADIAAIASQLFHWARKDPKLKVLPAVERALVVEALKATQHNQVQAAKLLGVTRATLRKRIEKFEIHRQLNIE
jgi:two-component system nitrogen regulation response regulator GlnG